MDADISRFETLADPTRLQILEILRAGEQPVGQIVERLSIAQSGVSRHLAILKAAGFVQVRPDGQRRLYALRADRFVELERWLDGFRDLWESRLDRLERELKKRKKEKKR